MVSSTVNIAAYPCVPLVRWHTSAAATILVNFTTTWYAACLRVVLSLHIIWSREIFHIFQPTGTVLFSRFVRLDCRQLIVDYFGLNIDCRRLKPRRLCIIPNLAIRRAGRGCGGFFTPVRRVRYQQRRSTVPSISVATESPSASLNLQRVFCEY